MRVWIENPFDNLPLEGFRPQRYWLMAQAFAAAGHEVTLWTSDFNHTTKRKREMRPEIRREDLPEGVECMLVGAVPYRKNVSALRLFSHWLYAKAWMRKAYLRAAERGAPDILIVSSPPLYTGAVARRLKRRFGGNGGMRLVIDVMDAWPETFERVAPRWMLAPLRELARRNYLGADMVTAVADRYIDLVRGYGFTGAAKRFYHGIAARGGAVAAEAPGRAAAQGGPSAAGRAGCLRLVYVGNLGRTYDLSTVLAALDRLPGATLDIAGKGEQEAELVRMAGEKGLSRRVAFRGYLGGEDLDRLLSECDIGIVPMDPESCVGVPYKFADYARAGLAMASSLGGESEALLVRYGAGEGYRGADPADLARAITDLSRRLDAARRGSERLMAEEFDASRIYSDYVASVMDMARARP